MSVMTGTDETLTEHSQGVALASLALAVAIPAFLAILGIGLHGWEAVFWAGAIVWGAVGALAMSIVWAMGRAMEMTRLSMSALLGSMLAEPDTTEARSVGMGLHLIVGALLGVAWVYTMALFNWAATWLSGMLWGGFISLLALLMISSIGVVHPKIRDGREEDPGTAGENLGKMTPFAIVVAHLVFGLVLGGMYQLAPLG